MEPPHPHLKETRDLEELLWNPKFLHRWIRLVMHIPNRLNEDNCRFSGKKSKPDSRLKIASSVVLFWLSLNPFRAACSETKRDLEEKLFSNKKYRNYCHVWSDDEPTGFRKRITAIGSAKKPLQTQNVKIPLAGGYSRKGLKIAQTPIGSLPIEAVERPSEIGSIWTTKARPTVYLTLPLFSARFSSHPYTKRENA